MMTASDWKEPNDLISGKQRKRKLAQKSESWLLIFRQRFRVNNTRRLSNPKRKMEWKSLTLRAKDANNDWDGGNFARAKKRWKRWQETSFIVAVSFAVRRRSIKKRTDRIQSAITTGAGNLAKRLEIPPPFFQESIDAEKNSWLLCGWMFKRFTSVAKHSIVTFFRDCDCVLFLLVKENSWSIDTWKIFAF